jgi:phospholipid/cholesterol/gamma-HCH transport system permease protein
MSESPAQSRWEVEDADDAKIVRLAGQWTLLGHTRRKREIARELAGLAGSGRRLVWDLGEVQALDSAAALLLWHVWGKRLPDDLRCAPEKRRRFERLKNLSEPAPRRRNWLRPIDQLGAYVIAVLRGIGEIALLVGQLLVDAVFAITHPRSIPWKEISATVYKTGWTSLPLLGLIGALVGVVMTYQIAMTVRSFGANTMVISLLGLAMIRELGPVITAIILVGRSGSAITAGIGTMHITQEFDALRTFGASPTLRLVLPRVIAMIVAVPLLGIWTEFTGLMGGMLTAQMRLGVRYQLFLQQLPDAVPKVNFWIGLGKGAIFGLIIAVVSAYFGLKSRADTESLSQQTTNAVVAGLSLIIGLDAISGALLANVGL